MDTETTEGDVNTTNDTEHVEEVEADVVKLPKAEYDKLNQTLGSLKREVKDLKKSTQTQETTKEPEQSKNEPDYGRLAYLQARGIAHPDDQQVAQAEADRLKLPLTDVLEMEHIKAKLKSQQEDREAKAGTTIKGGKRVGGTTAHDVEHWLANGETPPDQELAEKVVEARMKQHTTNKFSDELYTG